MLTVRVRAASIEAVYVDSNEYAFSDPEYQFMGKDSFFSWIADPEGKIGGIELYLSPDTPLYQHLKRLTVSMPVSADTPFVELYFAPAFAGESMMNSGFGDYYYYSSSLDRVVMLLPRAYFLTPLDQPAPLLA